MTLDRAISRMLDNGEAEAIRDRLTKATLPVTGNTASAACIAELAGFPVHHTGRQPIQRFA